MFRSIVSICFLILSCCISFGQDSNTEGDCSPNILESSNVEFNCHFDRSPGLSFETFIRQVLVSEFENQRRSSTNWALFAQNTGSKAYLRALKSRGVLNGVNWMEPLYLGGAQIQSASGLNTINWWFELTGNRSWFNSAELSPMELSNGIILEDVLNALKQEFESIGAQLSPLACEGGLNRFWRYSVKVPGYQTAIFTHSESSGASLDSIFFHFETIEFGGDVRSFISRREGDRSRCGSFYF